MQTDLDNLSLSQLAAELQCSLDSAFERPHVALGSSAKLIQSAPLFPLSGSDRPALCDVAVVDGVSLFIGPLLVE